MSGACVEVLPLLAARCQLAVLVADHCTGNPRIPGEVVLKHMPGGELHQAIDPFGRTLRGHTAWQDLKGRLGILFVTHREGRACIFSVSRG